MSVSGNIGRKLAAGKPGTKKMVEKYGDDLVCVRYRYDSVKRVKYKTVEIIVEKRLWDTKALEIKRDRIVGVKVGIDEIEIRKKVKDAGGKWNHEQRVWELNYNSVKALKITDRIVKNFPI